MCNYAGKPILASDLRCDQFEGRLADETGRLQPNRVACRILDQGELVLATLKDSEEILCYDERMGIWHVDGEVRIKELVRRLVAKDSNLDKQLTTHSMKEILARIRWSTYVDRSDFDPPPKKICVTNGVLDLDRAELKPHDPSYQFRNRMPVRCDPSATCPDIERFLDRVVPEYKDTIFELLGYCLIPGNQLQRAVLCVGFGNNGKSTFLNLVKMFLGPENVSSRSLQELLEHRFATADLDGKLANIYADIPSKALVDTGRFKILTGGDLLTAEHKFQKSFQFVNGAKLFFSCNIVPETKDDSDAFYRRWIIIPFTQTISDDEADRYILDKLTTPSELSGLLNKALDGRRRLLANGRFSKEDNAERNRISYTKLSDPVTCFIQDEVLIGGEETTPKQDLYLAFQAYCARKKYGRAYSQKRFFKEFMEKAPSGQVVEVRPKVDGSQIRMYRGVRLSVSTDNSQSVLNEVTSR
jgi:putative DNA primase/helicase